MTRPLYQRNAAKALIEQGMSASDAAERLGIPRRTVGTWVEKGFVARKPPPTGSSRCDPCPFIEQMAHNPAYAYLLGLYLGDGNLSPFQRGVYRLRVTLDLKYPGIIEECYCAIRCVRTGRVGETRRIGCVDVCSYWKHWACLFPQHGPGPKHTRPILLEPWQRRVALEHYPHLLLRGLIHSDGCRLMNNVKVRGKRYAYPRYHFSNRSTDIHAIFTEACAAVGVACRFNNAWNQSIARKEDVRRMDLFVGAKF